MKHVVELDAIGKQFPGVRALHDVSLSIGAGEVLGLVGENGAGKSTLIKILGGVYPAGSFTGEVRVAGRPQAFRSTRDARAAGIAVVHQELALIPDMTVADNLVLGREPTRFGIVDRNRADAMAKGMLRAVLGDDAHAIDLATPVAHLGVGIQQILEIARALADQARVIVLDEPTAALTDGEIARLFTLVRARRAAGASFVYISHRLEEIAALCDRVAVMRDGELVGVVPNTTHTDDLVAMMTGKELGDVHAPHARGAELGAPMLEVDGLCVAHPTLAGPDRHVVHDLVVHGARRRGRRARRGDGRRAHRDPVRAVRHRAQHRDRLGQGRRQARHAPHPGRRDRRRPRLRPRGSQGPGPRPRRERRRQPRPRRAAAACRGSASSMPRAPSRPPSPAFATSPSRCRGSAPRSRPSPAATSRRS